jgi:hypothetical protein
MDAEDRRSFVEPNHPAVGRTPERLGGPLEGETLDPALRSGTEILRGPIEGDDLDETSDAPGCRLLSLVSLLAVPHTALVQIPIAVECRQ